MLGGGSGKNVLSWTRGNSDPEPISNYHSNHFLSSFDNLLIIFYTFNNLLQSRGLKKEGKNADKGKNFGEILKQSRKEGREIYARQPMF